MTTELDALDPLPEQVKLQSGFVVQLESLRARQFFKLLRIITHGALPSMRDASLFDLDGVGQEEFTARLLSVTLLSIPDAEEETIAFVRSLCSPAGVIDRKGLNKQDQERNLALWEQLDQELFNPELDDLVSILEAVVRRESEDMIALGKRLASMFKLAQKTGQIPAKSSPSPQASTPASSAASPARSTSSRRSTSGRTRSSSTSHSAESDSASLPSESDSTTPVGNSSNG